MKSIIFVLGYGQTYALSTGLRDLAVETANKHHNAQVRLLKWDTNPAGVATMINGAAMLVGYSYGGYTCALIAQYLYKKKIPIEYCMLIDPVWRKKAHRAGLKSLTRNKKIKLPPNVKVAYTWRQTNGLIKGSPVATTSKTTHYASKCTGGHIGMDNNPVIHKKIRDCSTIFLA